MKIFHGIDSLYVMKKSPLSRETTNGLFFNTEYFFLKELADDN